MASFDKEALFDAIAANEDGWQDTVIENWCKLNPDDRQRIRIISRGNGGSGGGGSGDVSRSGATSDNRLARWSGTGATIQNSTWTLTDAGLMSATVSAEDDVALTLTSSGVASFGVKVTASGTNAVGLQGIASSTTSVGVIGLANAAGAVGVRAQQGNATGIALQIINNGSFVANIGFLGTATRAINFPDKAGTVLLSSDLGTNVATFLATPTSANLLTALTDGTGTGVAVFGTSPTITTSLVAGSTTMALFNTVATTVNAFGVTTTLNVGAAAALVLNFGGHTSAAEFRFLEPSGSGTNYIGFKAAAMAASTTYVLPTVAATAGQILSADATPTNLKWIDPGAASVDQAANYTWTGDHDFSGGTVILPTITTINATNVNVSAMAPATDD